MRNTLWAKLLFICAVALAFVLPAYCNQTITVVGVSVIEGVDTTTARSKALSVACRNAVTEGIDVWMRTEIEIEDSTSIREELLTHADGYVTYDIIKEGANAGSYSVTLQADVAVDRIGADFKKLVAKVKKQMGNPSVAFVLTTWEVRGVQGSQSSDVSIKTSVDDHETVKYDNGADTKTSDKIDAALETKNKGNSQEQTSTNDKSSVSQSGKSAGSADVTYSGKDYEKLNATSDVKETASINAAARDDYQGNASVHASENGTSSPNGASGNASMNYSGSDSEKLSASADVKETSDVALMARDEYNGTASVRGNEASSSTADSKSAVDSSKSNAYDNNYAGSVNSKVDETNSVRDKGWSDVDSSSNVDVNVKKNSSYFTISEDVWKKYPDPQIIDAFQQEFREKRFDIMAADRAREIALTPSLAGSSVNLNDRKAVREFAQKEGANFVARGEVRVLDVRVSNATGNYEATSQVGVEIIDVNSGDVVASYSNTVTASTPTEREARAQAILKAAVVAAQSLAGQTLETWQERAQNGRQYTIEVHNITSVRGQQRPLLSMIQECAEVTNTVNPETGVLLVRVLFKGDKMALENALLDKMDGKPGFSEQEFDGPSDKNGNLYFEFTK